MSHTWLISQFYFSLGKEESNQRICSFHFTHFGNTRHTCIHYSMALDWTKWAVGMPVPSLTDTGHVKFQSKQPRVCLQPIWGGSGIESLSVSDAASSWCTWKAEGSSSWARDTHGGPCMVFLVPDLPGPGIWGINQQMEHYSLICSVSLCYSTFEINKNQ